MILYIEARPGAALVGVVLAAMGIFPSIPVALAWVSSNAGGDIKRGVAIALVNGLGNLGGCVTFCSTIFLVNDLIKPFQDLFLFYLLRSATVPYRSWNKHGFTGFIVRLLLIHIDRRFFADDVLAYCCLWLSCGTSTESTKRRRGYAEIVESLTINKMISVTKEMTAPCSDILSSSSPACNPLRLTACSYSEALRLWLFSCI